MDSTEGTDPRFAHDCDMCRFLGTFLTHEGVDTDLYYCPNGQATVVARFGNSGPEYISGMDSGHSALLEARKRARALQYIT